MRRVLAVAAGIVGGILLAGVVSPPLMMILPPQLRGPQLLWATMAVVVPLTVWAAWWASGRR